MPAENAGYWVATEADAIISPITTAYRPTYHQRIPATTIPEPGIIVLVYTNTHAKQINNAFIQFTHNISMILKYK